jgi:adenosine deaminase
MDTAGDSCPTWFDRVPKVELHLHLEGAIPLPALWALIEKYGGDPSVPTVRDLAARFAYRDFDHFIDTWVWKNRFLREYEDFTFIAREVGRDLTRQNVIYAEIFYSPGDYLSRGLEPGRITEAIRSGLDDASELETALIADLIRDHGAERAARMLAAVNDAREFGVVGVGLGGSESEFPPENFQDVFARARELGFRTTAHAGEAAGPASIWGAIRALSADRIGHGTRAAEDPELVEHLAATRLPLELCIVSNLRTGVIRSVREHPARLYFDRGIALSINTDDPKMFGTSLADEYRILYSELGFSLAEIASLILQGVETSWLPEERKALVGARLQSEIKAIE